ncbi:hypothetical protein [Chondromyces crocatus]|uniref:SMP-30/Gluconolactonase/LRE-like region domain-containing protein n=1 Tax=Chondromyces crocatus TaxID=52 RepID=A0A0K1EJZ7_CHOCO|nr:hypothetical protein [Chondromyces crocatus]AKT41186.1 uncharacterized protein CMC5_053470 [Chondromyces crocatus]
MDTLRSEFSADALRSLAWAGDDLVDWIGGRRIRMDGCVERFGTGYTYRFDAVVGLGEVGVMFEACGTKGRVVRSNGALASAQFVPLGIEELREIDRSFYCAENVAFPVCVFTLPDGRSALAHAPRSYNELEIELLDGTPLTRRQGTCDDVFHARLSVSPDGRWLLSNGWVWHPWTVAQVYDVARALTEPTHLSGPGLALDFGASFKGEAEAAVISGDRLIVSGSAECPMLSVVELPSGKLQAAHPLRVSLGTQLVAWGRDHVLALDGEVRVVALADGEVVTTLDADTRGSSRPAIPTAPPKPPYIAIDPVRPRLAIGRATGEIVTFTLSS